MHVPLSILILAAVAPLAQAQVARSRPPAALNDKDVESPITNPSFAHFQAQCRLDVRIDGELPKPAAEPRRGAKVAFHPGAGKTIAQINQRRYDDSRDPRIGGTFLDPAIQRHGHHLFGVTGAGLVQAMWTPRHKAPPFFKVFEHDLDRKLDEIHVLPTEDPFLVAIVGFRAGYSEPYQLIVGPYCFVSNQQLEK